MKARKTADGFTVRLIAGTRVVVIALDLSEEKRRGCLGFSIQRTTLGPSGAAGEIVWLQHQVNGKPTSMEQAPLQAFRREDNKVHPATRYRYRVVARYSLSGIKETDPILEVDITTEDPQKPHTAIFFNRGLGQSGIFGAQFAQLIWPNYRRKWSRRLKLGFPMDWKKD